MTLKRILILICITLSTIIAATILNSQTITPKPGASEFLENKSSVDGNNHWSIAGDKIRTKWAEEINVENILPEYPRPQLVRERWKNLNGLWDYSINDGEKGQILVPFCIESALSGVGKTLEEGDVLTYTTAFTVPRSWKKDRLILNFGAVDWKAEVFVNDKKVGEHTGGYTPFSFDITNFVDSKTKEQKLVVRVTDPTDREQIPRGKQVTNPRTIWYTAVTGIWQTVWLEPVSKKCIKSYYTESNIEKGELSFFIDSEAEEGDLYLIDVFDATNKLVAKTSSTVVAPVKACPENSSKISLNIPDANLWSPENPYLYKVIIKLKEKSTVLDEVEAYAAMREVGIVRDESGHKRLTLNNEIIFHYGPLDQGWWPDGLYTAPSDDALAYDIIKTKDFGFNMIRKHIKVEPARWFYHCDRLGVLVWQDMPSIDDNKKNEWKGKIECGGTDTPVSEEAKANYYKEWTEVMNFARTFPCVVMWVPFNEAWGQFETDKVVEFTRSIDSTRPINPASGGNHRLCGDVVDLHNYPHPSMYIYRPDYVNVLGEYGGIAFPVEGHLWQTNKNWGYIKFDGASEVLATYEKYANQLKDLKDKGFAAAVYTQTTDVEIEVNGLMTYDRKVVKLDEQKLNEINTSVIEH